ncbi:MAG: transcription antitermination factor NusB [Planctomycetota bacterium]
MFETKRTPARHQWVSARGGAETAIVLGVMRRRGTLDAILSTYSSRKLPLLKPETRTILRAGLFELLYLDGSPDHAVVDAAVENVRRMGRPQDVSFVNALLRGIRRAVQRVDLAGATDRRRALPREEFAWYFPRSVFPDRNHDAAGFLAARGSTARWIAERRLEEHGLERALRILDAQAETPATHIRPAPGTRETVRETLEAAGVPVSDGPHDALLTLPPQVRMSEVFELCGGEIVVQDAVASQVAPFLAPEPGWRVLDYCAAPGGKATHLAQLGADVTAWDIDAERLDKVRENAERLGLTNLVCAEPDGTYDAVLVDAPCSNSGVLARRPEARWRVKKKHLGNLIERQNKLLRVAAEHVRPGGVLVYSTCSIEPDENRGVVDTFTARGGAVLERDHTCYPDEWRGDGGYMARLVIAG